MTVGIHFALEVYSQKRAYKLATQTYNLETKLRHHSPTCPWKVAPGLAQWPVSATTYQKRSWRKTLRRIGGKWLQSVKEHALSGSIRALQFWRSHRGWLHWFKPCTCIPIFRKVNFLLARFGKAGLAHSLTTTLRHLSRCWSSKARRGSGGIHLDFMPTSSSKAIPSSGKLQ